MSKVGSKGGKVASPTKDAGATSEDRGTLDRLRTAAGKAASRAASGTVAGAAIVRDATITAGTSVRDASVRGAAFVSSKAREGAKAVRGKWEELTPGQRDGVKTAGAVFLALLVIRRLLGAVRGKKDRTVRYAVNGSARHETREFSALTTTTSTLDGFATPKGSPLKAANRSIPGSPSKAASPSRPSPSRPSSPRPRPPRPVRSRMTRKRVDVLDVSAGATAQAGKGEFSVMTYGCVTDLAARGVSYRHIKPDFLKWEHRFPLLMEQIVRHGADVVCLQGLDPTNKSFTWLRTMRQLGYEGVIQDRSKSGGYTAVATFWLASKFERAPTWEDHRPRALLLELRPLWPKARPLLVANMDLEGHQHRPQDRVLQARGLLSSMVRRAEERGAKTLHAAVVACGSIGGDVTSGAYEFVVEGNLPEGATEPSSPGLVLTERDVAHPFTLQDAYAAVNAEVPFTYKPAWAREGVVEDFIFHSSVLELRAVTCPASYADVGAMRTLPNDRVPSDHLPLAAVFKAF